MLAAGGPPPGCHVSPLANRPWSRRTCRSLHVTGDTFTNMRGPLQCHKVLSQVGSRTDGNLGPLTAGRDTALGSDTGAELGTGELCRAEQEAIVAYSNVYSPMRVVLVGRHVGSGADRPDQFGGAEGSTSAAGSPVNCDVLKSGFVPLHFASPASRKSDFTQIVDPHAEVLKRLELEHRKRCGRALYVLQQIQSDPLRMGRAVAPIAARMRDLVFRDDDFMFSRVKGEVRDDGVQWFAT